MAKYECSEHMHNFLKELPKCEHHVHLEGTLGPELLFPLALRNNIKLPSEFPKTPEDLQIRYDNFADLQDFLNFYYIGMNVLITSEDFFDLAWSYFVKAKNDGLHHAECFFDPQGHTERGIPIDVVIQGFKKAQLKAEKELGISTKLIMCLLRHLPVNNCMDTLQSSLSYYQNGDIVGLGLDSSERPFPPKLFESCYKLINDQFPNVGLTAHAGEEGGPDYIHDALNYLNVTRIDHGVNSCKDDELLKTLAKNQTMLSLCPLSNVKLQVVKDVSELPILKWLEYGVPFSINSDDPAYFGGFILDNYVAVHTRFGFDLDTWGLIAKNGVNGSWITDNRKNEILQEIDSILTKYRPLLEN